MANASPLLRELVAGPVHQRGRMTSTIARSHMFRALAHRNYRLFLTGQTVSLMGTWITRVATSWLVYRLTGSALMLGVVGFWGQIPTLVLSPFAGVLVDRWDRHRIMVWTQALAALQSFALAILVLTGNITVPLILVLQLLQGIINAFDAPARQSFVVQMVDDPDDLPNAIALNSTMVNASRIVGPSIGGVIIAAVGEGWCFMVDAISYLAVIASLLAMRVQAAPPRANRGAMLDELRAGFHYVSRFAPVRSALLLLALVSTLGMPYTVLMPVMATQVLHGGPHTLGILMGASGLGAIASALYLASRKSVLGLGRIMAIGTFVFGIGLVAFGMSRSIWLALIALPLAGAGFMTEMAATNTILQTVTEDHLRGRVMAFYTMAFLGTAPLGSLLAGVAADRIGAPLTIVLGGVACVAGAAWLALRLPGLREQVRPIYVQRGILAAEQGLQTE
jgi:predicted MFS family arabinose efflux permease